ncbi:MAG: HEAT repeat domain-containing protein [Gemmatimonadota bacterium]|nr:HEAT repeat domain-containing protein [Gemmatimonadota bacterium]
MEVSQNSLTPPPAGARSAADPGDAAVSETLKALARAFRSFQLYLPNNPMHVRAIDSARSAFVSLWQKMDGVELLVTETGFLRGETTVYAEADRGGESLPWLFYKDGIRTIEIRKGFEDKELPRFLSALQAARAQVSGEEDLVTLFWECDFDCLSYTYEEAGGEGYTAPGAEFLRGGAPGGEIDSPAEIEKDEGSYGSGSSQFAKISDFDSTLYFLEEQEIAYLQQAVRDDFTGDLRLSVAAALLDTFEAQKDPTVREEICAVFEQFLIALLTRLQFRTAAFLLRECTVAAARADDLLSSHRERLGQLVSQMSDPLTMNQLLDELELTELTPPQQDLVALFDQLTAPAMSPLISHLVNTRNSALRALIEGSVNRLAGANPEVLMSLIGSKDEAVALEAIRRAGHLQSPAAVGNLAAAFESESDRIRTAAIEALGRIGTPSAFRVMEKGIDDADRDVRMTVVRMLCDAGHKPILARVEAAIKDRLLREGTSAEKTAFFEGYTQLAGADAVPLLESILVPRGMLGKREDPVTRACAAMALGRLGNERALDAVRKVMNDKEVIVRSAAARVVRGSP